MCNCGPAHKDHHRGFSTSVPLIILELQVVLDIFVVMKFYPGYNQGVTQRLVIQARFGYSGLS